jgi:carbon starvation protein
MNSSVLAIIGLGAMFLGYLFYSKFIAERIYRLDPNFKTPAHTMRDDVDYVPTGKMVLWGHHFTAVAGAAPIIGPGIAVIWGWLPAFLWVVFGTIFFAGVHDFGAVWASARNGARSIGSLTGDIVSQRAGRLFMVVIFLLLLMVNAVFAVAISQAFDLTPASVIPAWAAIGIAVVVGVFFYRAHTNIVWPTIIGTALIFAFIPVGDYVPVTLPATFLGLGSGAQWIILLFVYATIAALLPVWMLLQPRGYISGIMLFVGLGLLYGAVLIAHPTVVAPAWNTNVPAGTPSLVPLLFVTIACGAISGFHGLVGSGTTSKQLDKETDARPVGYLGSTGEGTLALIAIIAATAGFATRADWDAVYTTFGAGGQNAFVQGGAAIVAAGLPLSSNFAAVLLTVMVVLFAGTTMDVGVRLQRYIIQEWGVIYNIPAIQNGYTATFLAVASCLALAFGAGGMAGTGGMIIWPLFGTTNQLLAGLTLLVISVLLVKQGRPSRYTMVPMVFVTAMSFLSALYQLWDLYSTGQYFLVFIDLLIVVTAIFVMLEASSAFMRERRVAAAAAASVG